MTKFEAGANLGHVTLATPRGRGAVATIVFRGECCRLDSGDRPLFVAVNGRALADQPINRIVFGRWLSALSEISEEVVVCRRSSEILEIHCHGGDVAADRILRDLVDAGCTVEPWTNFNFRNQPALDRERLVALSQVRTMRTAEVLARQTTESVASKLQVLQELELSNGAARDKAIETLDRWLSWSVFGLHLTEPWSVVITGRPNVGKSSLLNALLGFSRSIVFDEPGTTRDVVTAETAFDGWPVVLADTAGWREPPKSGTAPELEREGIQRARQQLHSADCQLLVLDLSQPLTQDDHALLADWPKAIIVGNKADVVGCRSRQLPFPMIKVAARTGAGIDQIIREIVNRLIPRMPGIDDLVPFTERQVICLSQATTALAQQDRRGFAEAVNAILA